MKIPNKCKLNLLQWHTCQKDSFKEWTKHETKDSLKSSEWELEKPRMSLEVGQDLKPKEIFMSKIVSS
jgi:hypothetical protein